MRRGAAEGRTDWPWMLGLALLGLVSRAPFVTRILYHWDAVNFTLALKEYNISIHQPQPPGYLLYVLLGRLANALLPDPNQALTAISIISSIAAAVLLYDLGRRMFDRLTGAAASLLLLLGPLIWFYSDIAKPNIIDAPMVTLSALCLWRFLRGDRRWLVPSAVVLGLAGGFRQQTLVFLAPLAVFAFRKARFRDMLLGGGLTAVVFLASFIPMVVMAGGWGAYQEAMRGLSQTFFTRTSILMGGGMGGLITNVTKWVSFTLYSLMLALPVMLVWAAARARRLPAALRDERSWFLAFWILPSLLFYTLIHMGSHGLIFTYLPAVLLVAGKAFSDLAGLFGGAAGRVFAAGLLVAVAANVLVYLLAPDYLFGGRVHVVNNSTLAASDRLFANRFDLLHKNIDPAGTLVLTENWRHAQYYLPEYTVLSSPCQSAADEEVGLTGSYLVTGGKYLRLEAGDLPALTQKVKNLVLFDGPQGCFFPKEWAGRMEVLNQNGEQIYVLRLGKGENIQYINGTLHIIQ